jgi:putative tryptophan/tyrosine transport system substrate-binding protein
MRRRAFIAVTAAAAAWPLVARAQLAAKVARIGVLNPGGNDPPAAGGFYEGLTVLGYVEGQNIDIERRYAEWNPDRYLQLAAELAQLKVDVIVVMSTTPARAAKQATSTIPIVVVGMADPVGDELIASLARPGGNITGTTFLGPELIAKRFGLLREAIPGLVRVAALWHPSAYGKRTMEGLLQLTKVSASALGLQLQLVQANDPNDIDGAFTTMTKERAEAFIVSPSPMLFGEYKRIVKLAADNRLPAMYAAREFADAGGFMAYGANLSDVFRRAATYVDKILKGAKPADLPVEQPTKFEFVINAKTAKTLGVTLPPHMLALADDVIE